MAVTALFGGTFDPVHLGHQRLAEEVVRAVNPDRMIIIPTRIPPHKQAKDIASESDRLEMCRLAFLEIGSAIVSDYELKRDGKSYSVYTVQHFRELYSDDKLYFIMGSDMLLTFHQWYRYEEIAKMCGIICVSRLGEHCAELKKRAEELRAMCGVILLDVPPLELSSTQIRDRLKSREDCSMYLDKKVLKYISERNLYL